MTKTLSRRAVLTGLSVAAPALLAGCDSLGASPGFRSNVLGLGEWMNYRMHRLLFANSLAPEFAEDQMSPVFRANGNETAGSAIYRQHLAQKFSRWRLPVGGLVQRPMALSLSDLQARPARTQITEHTCVEGWTAIGKWTGAPLGPILTEAGLSPQARFIVFHCADDFNGTPYYESIDLVDAFHPQTILAYGMNGAALPERHGAPLRLRVERQLGYKQAKFVMRIEAVADLAQIGRGRGGYWEDAGRYAWYAGI